MKNIKLIESVIDYIENNLTGELDISTISKFIGYSPYHLSRIFSTCIGFSIYEYIRRRRITEAARKLVKSDEEIINIAMEYGYSNQQSFSVSFKKIYHCSPNQYRKRNEYMPYQLKLKPLPQKILKGDMIIEIRQVKNYEFKVVGFTFNTKDGFQNIGPLWGKLHSLKNNIICKTNNDFTIAVNYYNSMDDSNQFFDYYTVVEVSDFKNVPNGMITKTLPISNYIVFKYLGRVEDSLEPVVNYIYKEWFPESDKILNEDAKFDLVKYGEDKDKNGNSIIEFWVPIK